MAKKLIIDCDPGIDDALALILAARVPDAQLLGLTTLAGNLPLSVTTGNATALAREIGLKPEILVWPGAAGPLQREFVDAGHIHGPRGLGNWHPEQDWSRVGLEHAVSFIARQASSYPGEITLVATGPLTNVALLLEYHAQEALHLAEVVFMGGALRVPGNVTPQAEFNIWADPEAAAAVLSSSLPLKMVGLDVTRQVLLTKSDLRRISKASILGVRAASMVEYYLDNLGVEGCPLHDPLALMAALRPELFGFKELPVQVETSGCYSRGATIIHPGAPGLPAAMTVDREACREWLISVFSKS
jgi:inosine-uridine nucleoside N-ribohydrolase